MNKVSETLTTSLIAPVALVCWVCFAVCGAIGDKWAEHKDNLRRAHEESPIIPFAAFAEVGLFKMIVCIAYDVANFLS